MSVNISKTQLNSTSTKTKVEGCKFNYAMNNIKLNCKNCTKLERGA
jgi:Zn finger protein HypA/HybF involved in hydrogenase expression